MGGKWWSTWGRSDVAIPTILSLASGGGGLTPELTIAVLHLA
jgi:hypothetical protein